MCENLSMDNTSFKDAGRSHIVEVQNADVEVEAWVKSEDSGNAVTSVDRIKVPSFKGSMSWAMFNNQFDALAEHRNWAVWEKAVDALHSVPAEAMWSTWGLL